MKKSINFILEEMLDGENVIIVGHGNTMGRYAKKIIKTENFSHFENASFIKIKFNNKKVSFSKYFCLSSSEINN